MADVNERKRAAHRRRVHAALQQILNDPNVMPNADCADLVVFVSRVAFGRTVRDIFIDISGRWKQQYIAGTETPHERYMRAARQDGKDTYADLTDVCLFPSLMRVVEEELQKRLALSYTPTIRRFCDAGLE